MLRNVHLRPKLKDLFSKQNKGNNVKIQNKINVLCLNTRWRLTTAWLHLGYVLTAADPNPKF